MSVYYNENDPYPAQWLRNLIKEKLIPDGDVDERSIRDVQPDDLKGYYQCHFFAGIGGWPYALRLAGWPDDRQVWTGSCPCQPFSVAGKRKGTSDERHLWPDFRRLIGERLPTTIFGEQVAGAPDWLRVVRSEMVAMGYAVGAYPIQASSVGAFTSRERFFFVADAAGQRGRGRSKVASRTSAQPRGPSETIRSLARPKHRGCVGALAVSDVLQPSYGVPARVAKLRALGNAIVPQVAAEFIGAYLDSRELAA